MNNITNNLASQANPPRTIKKPDTRLSPEQRNNLTPEQRRYIYDRRSPAFRIRKQRKQEQEYLSDSDLIKFLDSQLLPTETKVVATKVLTYAHTYVRESQNIACPASDTNVFSDIEADIATEMEIYADLEVPTQNNVTLTIFTKPTQPIPKRIGLELVPTEKKNEGWQANIDWLTDANGKRFQTKTPKKGMMKQITIPKPIQDVTSFKPTNAGIADLCLFDPDIITKVDQEILKANDVKDHFKYFVFLCQKYSKLQGLPLNYGLKNEAVIALGIKDSDARFDPTYQKPKPTPKPQVQQNFSSKASPGFKEFAANKEQARLEKEAKRTGQLEWDEANPYLAAKKIEAALHNPEYQRGIKLLWPPKTYNAWFTQLNGIEQRLLLGEVHADCECNRDFLSVPSSVSVTLDQAKHSMMATLPDMVQVQNVTTSHTLEDEIQPPLFDGYNDDSPWEEVY